MKYNYKCNKCSITKIIEQNMSDNIVRNIPCECGGVLNQDIFGKLKTMKFSIPCTFNSEYTPKKYEQSTELENYISSLED